MTDLITIELKQLHFFAYHGVYAEERKTGNEFEVNLSVSYRPLAGTITGITDTIDYGELYTLVRTEMQKPRELLETLVMEITEIIHISFPQLKTIAISVSKLHLPIIKFRGMATVRYSQEF